MSVEDRVKGLETRVQNLEKFIRHLAATQQAGGTAASAVAPPISIPTEPVAPSSGVSDPWAAPARVGTTAPAPVATSAPPRRPPPSSAPGIDAGRVLGIGGVIALLLAASYLVGLALDSGWLTPVRQIGLACVLGLGMIVVGLALVRSDRQYGSLLPAGGLSVLYLAIFGAHNLYGLIGVMPAAVLITLLSIAALALGHHLRTDIYALLAAWTSYSVPLLLPVLRSDVLGLALYFCAWSVVYTTYAVIVRNRAVYLIAMYLGLALFASLPTVAPQWTQALLFQTLQLLIFGWGAVQFSIRTGAGMSDRAALAHAPALLFFYAVQYGTLNQHVPNIAPVIAVASAVVVLLLYLVASRRLGDSAVAGAKLATGYMALVLYHAVFVESLTDDTRPLLALLAAPLAAWCALYRPELNKKIWPLYAAVALMYLQSCAFLIRFFQPASGASNFAVLLAVLFAAELYYAYTLVRSDSNRETRNIVLYAAHVMGLNACMLVLDDRLMISFAWAGLAIITMLLGFRAQDRDLGRSALLILGFLSAKVMLYDLSGAPPIIRILSLLVLGVTLYGAGWIYQRKLTGEGTA